MEISPRLIYAPKLSLNFCGNKGKTRDGKKNSDRREKDYFLRFSSSPKLFTNFRRQFSAPIVSNSVANWTFLMPFFKNGIFSSTGHFSLLIKMQKKHEKMPHVCVSGIFFRSPYVVKIHLRHFFTEDGAFFRSEGLENPGVKVCPRTQLPGGH